jgi:hypothetical protein
MTAKHVTVRSQTRGVGRVDHILYMGNFLSFPDIFDDPHVRGINYCGTVRQNCKGMPRGLDKKTLKLKQGDVHVRVRGHLTAMVCKDK